MHFLYKKALGRCEKAPKRFSEGKPEPVGRRFAWRKSWGSLQTSLGSVWEYEEPSIGTLSLHNPKAWPTLCHCPWHGVQGLWNSVSRGATAHVPAGLVLPRVSSGYICHHPPNLAWLAQCSLPSEDDVKVCHPQDTYYSVNPIVPLAMPDTMANQIGELGTSLSNSVVVSSWYHGLSTSRPRIDQHWSSFLAPVNPYIPRYVLGVLGQNNSMTWHGRNRRHYPGKSKRPASVFLSFTHLCRWLSPCIGAHYHQTPNNTATQLIKQWKALTYNEFFRLVCEQD